MEVSNNEHLQDAIARNSPAMLMLPSAGMIRPYKSRFLGEQGAGLWIESCLGERALIDQLIANREIITIQFQTKTGTKLEFTGKIVSRDNEYRLNTGSLVEAIRIEVSSAIVEVQRRNHFRVRWPGDNEASMRIWRISETADISDEPLANFELRVTALDLSARGIAVLCHTKDNPNLRLAIGDRLRVELFYDDRELIVESRLRTVRLLESGAVRLGVEFSTLEADLNGRKIQSRLNVMIADLQRRELRSRASVLASTRG